jgi:hypothetical protein
MTNITDDEDTQAIEFLFRCSRQWDELEATEDSSVRFCTECDQNVYYIGTGSHAERGSVEFTCIAAKIGTRENPKGVVFVGQPEPVQSSLPRANRGANHVIYFGPISGLTPYQLETIKWLRILGANPIMKGETVRSVVRVATEQHLARIIRILEGEAIPFSLDEDPSGNH